MSNRSPHPDTGSHHTDWPGHSDGKLSEKCIALRDKKSMRRTPRFIRGPIPFDWLAKASQLSRTSLAVGILIHYRAGLECRRYNLPLYGDDLRKFGIGKTAAFNAVAKMEAVGLIGVDRRRGRCPRLTILNV